MLGIKLQKRKLMSIDSGTGDCYNLEMQRKKVAINGLGRIGKHAARIILKDFADSLELVAINSPGHDTKSAAYSINYDSVYGYFSEYDVLAGECLLYVNPAGKTEATSRIVLSGSFETTQLSWGELGVDIVIDCSGVHKDRVSASGHLQAGARKVVLSNPVSDPSIATVILGVNAQEQHFHLDIVSNSSCTTNCIASITSVIREHVSIQGLHGNTLHAYTQSQALLDKEGGKKGLRDSRAAGLNIIPSTTGASESIIKIFSELEGRVDLTSARVPVPSGSLVHATFMVNSSVSREEVNGWFVYASEHTHKGIVFFNQEELVSSDCIGTPYSAIVDGLSTHTMPGSIRVHAWYDNEYGYTKRLVELAEKMAHAG